MRNTGIKGRWVNDAVLDQAAQHACLAAQLQSLEARHVVQGPRSVVFFG
ncbi:MAG: hypothetical protein ACJA2W_001629 [Planctomycetota bacterium]|jgi:hypothetical protein